MYQRFPASDKHKRVASATEFSLQLAYHMLIHFPRDRSAGAGEHGLE
jgi:hypothetical protein